MAKIHTIKKLDAIANTVLNELKHIGAFKWHVSNYHSIYIKFRDTRLGSIRIADHNGREKYNYKYQLTDASNRKLIRATIFKIRDHAKSIPDFNPDKFIVYSTAQNKYVEVESFDEYKNVILKKVIA